MSETDALDTFFDHFTAEERECVRREGEIITCGKGEEVIPMNRVHSSLFLILEGSVRVLHTVEGRELILAELGPGETLGELAFIEPGEASALCRTTSSVRLLKLDRDGMERITRTDPKTAVKIWYRLALLLKRRLIKTNRDLASFFNISQSLAENDQFRAMYGTCFR